MATPKEIYQQDLIRPEFQHDPAQAAAVEQLQRLYLQMTEPQSESRPRSWWQKFRPQPQSQRSPQGLYFWGGVGRGKTYLVDTFFHCLPTERKMRIHFHRMMQRVHHELNELKGQQDPLMLVADRLAAETEIICFDEFFVSDITDAMLLAGLLEHLFARGVVLVATSNIPPHLLYRNGLQRQRFLPAIALIEQHCDIFELDSGIDYRLRTLEQAEIFHYPLDQRADENLQHYFSQLGQDEATPQSTIEILGRAISVVREGEGVLMVTFSSLCDGPRGQADYIELARLYHTVLLKDVRVMGSNNSGDDVARRFIAMVDEFYERGVKLIISAEAALEQLYGGGQLSFEFKRCQSRLTEMQSHDYLAKPHLP
ncbi:cell division protein ZapE [Ferrimonas lipolytica]|uniref:Cell division protein ZapE n=1 Tax=Ferrimonas lipolytica TaxID=2724191 RepID=A0A6H1UI31_9GAMM|nr:cell division protein ZapE [Ferrimonas lipolytica]QIZ77876.1 cell division protein ZapE [Ferrimonas lipolytica]